MINMKHKGISLPVEMIVIIALAVIVLLAAGAFFVMGTSGSTSNTIDIQAWQQGCGTMKLRGCLLTDFQNNLANVKVQGYDYNRDGTTDSALDACRRALGQPSATASQCHTDCCQAGGVGSSDDTRGRTTRPT